MGGYTSMVEHMLEGTEVLLEQDYFARREEFDSMAKRVLFTGMIDEFYGYCYGELEYRSLRFETEYLNVANYQGNAVVNYTEYEIPYTRIIEHKHFEFGKQEGTVITREYPSEWSRGDEPYYPLNDEKNNILYDKYKNLSKNEKKVLFGGRLGMYKYFDMHNVIEEAIKMYKKEMNLPS